jgi:hypothetical protein
VAASTAQRSVGSTGRTLAFSPLAFTWHRFLAPPAAPGAMKAGRRENRARGRMSQTCYKADSASALAVSGQSPVETLLVIIRYPSE